MPTKEKHAAEAAASEIIDRAEQIAQVQQEARKTFSLADRLRGVKHAERTVVLFDDPRPAEQWANLDRQRTSLEGLLGQQDLDAEARTDLTKAMESLEQSLTEVRADMEAHALHVRLRAVPPVVLKMAQHAALERFGVNRRIPEEQEENAEDFRNRFILGRVIQTITTPDGPLEFDRDSVARELEEALPVPQWRRLADTYTELVFTDAIGQAATDDPGF